MKINLPRGIEIDINNVPDNFEDIIIKSFSDYTEGTRDEYCHHDKLAYIDRCRELLHKSSNADECVMEIMKDYFEHEVSEYGTFPDSSDFLDVEFMAVCFESGKTNLYSTYADSGKRNDKILEILATVIKVVMNYEPK